MHLLGAHVVSARNFRDYRASLKALGDDLRLERVAPSPPPLGTRHQFDPARSLRLRGVTTVVHKVHPIRKGPSQCTLATQNGLWPETTAYRRSSTRSKKTTVWML